MLLLREYALIYFCSDIRYNDHQVGGGGNNKGVQEFLVKGHLGVIVQIGSKRFFKIK